MKNKTVRFLIIVVLIFGTLILSNYYIDYYKISDGNKAIISDNTEYVMRSNNILTSSEVNKILTDLTEITIVEESDDYEDIGKCSITYCIETNDDLSFFKTVQALNIKYEEVRDVPSLNISYEGIENLKLMPELKDINFNMTVSEYILEKEYSFDYTEEDEKEMIDKIKQEVEKENSALIDNLEKEGFKVNVNVEIK